jgi:hypothetical protein
LRFERVTDFHAALERIGHLPLPPYIRREKEVEDRAEDRERYQTVYSKPLESVEERGSSAAPTAGLHFTPEILEEIRERGVEIARLTLHVGLGTFQPVRAERTEEIKLHAESYTISAETAAAVNRARREDDDADAGAFGARGRGARRRDRGGVGEYEFIFVAGGGVQGGGWVVDELSSAGVDVVDAGVGLRGAGKRVSGLCACGEGAVPVF